MTGCDDGWIVLARCDRCGRGCVRFLSARACRNWRPSEGRPRIGRPDGGGGTAVRRCHPLSIGTTRASCQDGTRTSRLGTHSLLRTRRFCHTGPGCRSAKSARRSVKDLTSGPFWHFWHCAPRVPFLREGPVGRARPIFAGATNIKNGPDCSHRGRRKTCQEGTMRRLVCRCMPAPWVPIARARLRAAKICIESGPAVVSRDASKAYKMLNMLHLQGIALDS